jgi:hypothetical protein
LEGLEFLVYASDVNLNDKNINVTKNQVLSDTSKEVCPEVNDEKTKYMFTP